MTKMLFFLTVVALLIVKRNIPLGWTATTTSAHMPLICAKPWTKSQASSERRMSENPFQALCQAFDKISKSLQTHLSQFISVSHQQSSSNQPHLLVAVSSSSKPSSLSNPTNVDPTLPQPTDAHTKKSVAAPVTKEELGRATWAFLHTLAAQYPDRPTRQQKKDVKELVAILSRMYPCKECADHFKEVLRANPVQTDSQAELSRWFCHVHNVVNRSLDKPRFPCERVDARWGKLDCDQRACDLQGDTNIFGNLKY